MYPTGEFISATACIIIVVVLSIFAVSFKKKLDGSAVCVYARVTHIWTPPNSEPWGLSEHTYRVFAQWTNPYSQRTYYFVKQSHQPLDYRIGDIVPATIHPEHPWFRYLNI